MDGNQTALERLTQTYWTISCARRGKAPPNTSSTPSKITTGDALRQLGDCSNNLSPERLLARVTHELTFDIIEGDDNWRRPVVKEEVNGQQQSFRLIPFTQK